MSLCNWSFSADGLVLGVDQFFFHFSLDLVGRDGGAALGDEGAVFVLGVEVPHLEAGDDRLEQGGAFHQFHGPGLVHALFIEQEIHGDLVMVFAFFHHVRLGQQGFEFLDPGVQVLDVVVLVEDILQQRFDGNVLFIFDLFFQHLFLLGRQVHDIDFRQVFAGLLFVFAQNAENLVLLFLDVGLQLLDLLDGLLHLLHFRRNLGPGRALEKKISQYHDDQRQGADDIVDLF